MASLGSLPFLHEPSNASCTSFILQRRTFSWGRPPFAANWRPNFLGFALIGREKRKGLRATGKDGSFEVEEGGEGNSNDQLEATMEKSKKILAMQKNLLQQIAERRKLVSSIKESFASTMQDKVSDDESDKTSNLELSSTNRTSERKNDGSIKISDIYAPSSEAKISETHLSGDNGSSLVKQEGHDSSLHAKYSVQDAPESFKPASLKTAKLQVMPPSTLEASEFYYGAKLENLEDSGETNAESENEKSYVVPEKENTNSPLAGTNVMNVIVVAAECAPWSKTGGLGDVAGALPKALARRGHRVMVVAPRYGNYAEPQDTGVRKRYKTDGADMEVTYFHAYIDDVDFVFVDHPMFRHCENNIYGGERPDILRRMVLFCKAAIEVPWHVPCGGVCYGDGNLVFIANDWHTALLPVYLKAYYHDNGLMKYARSVLVIHNIAHQGRGPVDDFFFVDLPEHYIDLFKMHDPIGGDHFNIFAAGLKAAHRVVTVSDGYAWELKTSEGGWGLHEIINSNDWKFQGIVNGIDTKGWNPELDVHLKSDGYTNYSLETLQTGKPQCKAALQRELGLPVRNEVPIIAFIGRLDHQKGVDLIAEAMPWIVGQDVQLIMLGSGRPDLEEMLRRFEGQHHDKVRGWVGFSVKTAHRITAGADILLMPSRFEPCGLNQLYAMKYGMIPVVHAVGGLRDTVIQFDPYNETGFGWTFDRAEAGKLIHALGNCLNTYWNYKSSWAGLQRRGMMQDLSWDRAAQRYEEVLVAAKYQW